MIDGLGTGEVAHQERDAVILGLDPRRQCYRLVGGNAEPIHAGVDLERGAAFPAVAGNKGVPLGQFGHTVDDRSNVDVQEGRTRFGGKAVEHVNRGLERPRPNTARLGKISHEERLAACRRKPCRHRFEAQTIGVGFDDGRTLGGDGVMGQRAPVQFDSGEIDR